MRARISLRVLASVTALALAVGAPATALASPSSTTVEQGYENGEIQHPRSVAMAGANEALGGSTTAIFVNPANLALYRVYHLEGLAAFSPEARRQSYGGAIADSSTSRLAGGFGGTWSQMDPDGIHRTWADLRLTLAYPLGDRLSLGMTGRYLRVGQSTTAGPFGASLASGGTSDDPIFSQFTFDAGAALQITDRLRLGVSGKNLTATGSGLAPLMLAGGLGFSNGTVTVEADSLVDFTTYDSVRGRGMLGAEVLLADRFPVRAGYRYDAGTRAHGVGLGAGYVEKKFSIELGGRRDIIADHPATMISIGLRLFIDSGAAGGGGGDLGDTM
jgi:hypothetical protein